MPPKRERNPDLEINTSPDLLSDDLRRRDQPRTPPDSMPPSEDAVEGAEPAGGGFTPKADGGNADHPIHDDDPSEDAGPSDYEREIDRLDAAARTDS